VAWDAPPALRAISDQVAGSVGPDGHRAANGNLASMLDIAATWCRPEDWVATPPNRSGQ